ncbi:MAG: acyl-CoA dehydrogenase [Promethearchaeota archaeon]|nr:MAG: acyl-CoA dehydrogenase [Candidatus Lokiarchaeota archaeon]
MSENKFQTRAINEDIMEVMSLKNRYNFVNNNLMAILTPEQFSWLREVQRFCMRYEKKNNINHGPDEDVYDWIEDFGKKGYISRAHSFDAIDESYEYSGAVADFLRYLAIDNFDPQFAMGAGATVLAINPVFWHHENIPVRLEAMKDMVTGKAPGCILITEPERGSDAVHQLTTCDEQEDGSFLLNGDKIYNTNAPKSKWAVTYATAEKNNGNKMAQFLVNTEWDGWNCDRVFIPWVPKLYLGKEHLENLRVPKEYVLGGIGKGREHLFEGLVPERIGIACGAIAQCWGALSFAAIYSNVRKQFDQEILKFQGVGFLLTDLWARTTNVTLGLLKFCESFDEKVEKFGGEDKIPKNITQAMVASASQFKYHTTSLAKDVCYECANVMGGAGLSDNTLTHDYLNISRIQEIVGGSRQIQQYIMSMALRTLFKMSV